MLKKNIMKLLLYWIAAGMVIGWVLGFWVLHAPYFIHLLLAVAIVFMLLGVITRSRRA
jgi:hypothetical protein